MYQTRLSFNFILFNHQVRDISLFFFNTANRDMSDTFLFLQMTKQEKKINNRKREERSETSIKCSSNHNCKCSTFVSLLFNASLSLFPFCLVFISFVSLSSTLGFFIAICTLSRFVVRFDVSFAHTQSLSPRLFTGNGVAMQVNRKKRRRCARY